MNDDMSDDMSDDMNDDLNDGMNDGMNDDMNDDSKERKAGGLSRRRFLGRSAAAAAAWTLMPNANGAWAHGKARGTANVKIGAITYSFRQLPSSAEELLGYLLETGMTTTELMGGPAEAFAGAPEAPPFPGRRFSEMSEEEMAEFRQAREAYEQRVATWRSSVSQDRFRELGQMYNDAGIEIDILKLGNADWPDDQIDYAFNAARSVGARGISFEISEDAAARMSPFADKHGMLIGMHNHTQVGDEGFSFESMLAHSTHAMLNLDIGHYVAGTDESPIPVIQRYHDRISHLHIKDRRTGANGGDNVPFGEGDTPIVEVLHLLRDEQYPITAMIELEYPIPEDSDVITEMAKCVEYCMKVVAE